MDRQAWQATVHRVTKSWTRPKQLSMHPCTLISQVFLLKEGGPLPGPKSGLLYNTWKWIVWGDTHADKARDFIGKWCPGREQEGKGTQENCSAIWLTVLGFMVMGLVSGLSLANHSDSGSFLVVHALLSQDGFQQERFGEVAGHVASPFDPTWTALKSSFPNFEPAYCPMTSSNCCFLTCTQVSQEAGKVVWYSHLFKNFPQFVVNWL